MKQLLFTLFFLYSCGENKTYQSWKEIKQQGKVKILTVNSSTTYFKGREGGQEGFEYELADLFAKDHDLEAEFILKDSIKDVLLALQNGEGDIAASGLSITDNRLHSFSFSTSYFKSQQIIACRNRKKIQDPEKIKNLDIIVPKSTSFTENLHFLKKRFSKISWKEVDAMTSEILIQSAWKNPGLCTIADQHILNLHRRYMPELKNIYQFKAKEQIAWATVKENRRLLKQLNSWFNQENTQDQIIELKRKYFDFIDFDAYNLKVFSKRIKTRLPKYKKYFIAAADQYNIPWELLAAVGYQESYWNPKAKSPTGVRGLMMLTRRTAKDVGVKNRLDPAESIMGGTRYLKKLIARMPEYIHEDDKTWFALAAYNVGYYHLRDAMALTIFRNKNPTRWHEVQQVLPLLANRKYYKKLPFGHARGFEPVIYVKRIKDFYDILRRSSQQQK